MAFARRARSHIPERAAPMLEEAAERGRVSMRMRLERVRVAWRSVVQAGVAAPAAYLLATKVFGHSRPFFAPVAAIITLGLTYSARGRRAAELSIGVVLGIAIGDLIIYVTGVGAWQLAVVVVLAICVALLVGQSQLLVNQAAVSAALVATLQPPNHGVTFGRFLDALAGTTVALVISGLVLPVHPARLVRRAAGPVLEELAGTLDDVAGALGARDAAAAEEALERARAIDGLSGRFAEAISTGRETARFAVGRRRFRPFVETWADAAHSIDLAVRNVRVLSRGAIRAIRLDDNVPDDVLTSLRDLASAVRAIDPALAGEEGASDKVHTCALRAAARATLVLERTTNLSVSVIVGQIRSTATDLLAGAGMEVDDAADAVRNAAAEEAARELRG
jgi:Fusaric acid resistance protein-like